MDARLERLVNELNKVATRLSISATETADQMFAVHSLESAIRSLKMASLPLEMKAAENMPEPTDIQAVDVKIVDQESNPIYLPESELNIFDADKDLNS